jgi:hypothetical protein
LFVGEAHLDFVICYAIVVPATHPPDASPVAEVPRRTFTVGKIIHLDALTARNLADMPLSVEAGAAACAVEARVVLPPGNAMSKAPPVLVTSITAG